MERSDSKIKRFWRPANLIKIFLFLGIVCVCGVFFFIRSDAFLNWVEGQLETELKNRIMGDYTVDVGKIKGNILGSVTLSRLAISKKEAQDAPVISTGRVMLKYDLFGLLTRRFSVKTLVVSDAQIHAVRNADGVLNLTQIFKQHPTRNTSQSKQDASQFDFAAGRIELNRGSINYLDVQQDLRIAIEGISVGVDGELNTWDHKGWFRIGTGSFTFDGTEMPIDNFNADFVLLANGSRLNTLQLKFGNSDLEVKGGFTRGVNGTSWDGTLDLKLDVSDVEQFFGESVALKGAMTAKLVAEGTDSTLNIKTLSANMPTFSILRADDGREITLAELDVGANFKYSPTPAFSLTTFSAQIADGTLAGEGSITLENAPDGNLRTQLRQLTQHTFNYVGQWHATEIQLIPFLSMFAELPENLSDGTGSLSGTAKFSGKNADISSFNLDSEIALIGTVLDEVVLEDSTLNCRIQMGVLRANGNFDGTLIDITAPFPLGEQDTLDIQASGINFEKIMKIANSSNFGGIGTSSAQLSSDGTLKGLLEVPDATFNNIPIGVLTGDFRYQDGRVFIDNGLLTKNTISSQQETSEADSEVLQPATTESEITQYESQATINGTVDVKGDFPTAFSIVANPVYVQHYPRLLLGAEYPIDGEIRGELKLYGTLINLDGDANFSVTAGVAWGIHLDTLMLPLEIEDYNLSVPNFKITTREQQVTLNAAVAANGDFDLLLENDAPVRFEEIAKAANIGDFPFEGEFDVRVVGTLKKPERLDLRVELVFSDITYLHMDRGAKYLLGDAYLLGKLVERKHTIGAPDIYDFLGEGFDGTSRIRGIVSMAVDNPYRFIVASDGIEVSPFLSILHPTLEAVTGTADGSVSISGTIADLAPAEFSAEPRKEMVYPYDVDISIATSQLRYSNSTEQDALFTNVEPIRLHLRDDEWTIEKLSLKTLEDASPFLELAGSFDAKTEEMDLRARSDGFALVPFGQVLGLPHDALRTGTGRYAMHITGTPTLPVVVLDWSVPSLTLETEAGDIHISDAGGGIVYQEESLRFEDCAFKLLGNDVSVEGYIDVQSEDVNSSELHLRVDTIALDLTTLPNAGDEITGMLEASVEIGGTLDKPHAILYAETPAQQPINFTPYVPSITLERLRIDIYVNSESVHIQTVEANGLMGDGPYHADGEALFSRQDTDTMQFAIEVSASQVEVADYGVASGYVKVSGTDLALDQITVIGEINELELDSSDFRIVNRAPVRFRSDPQSSEERLVVQVLSQITSPTMEAAMNVTVGGTLAAPTITAEWNGAFNQKEWKGKIEYSDEQIRLTKIALKDGANTLTLTGVIPFNLAFAAMDISERHLGEPINLHLWGSELPIDFFPGVDMLFSKTDGTIDIDLTLQGTTCAPYMVGNVFLEALQLDLQNFHEPIRNMKLQLSASENMVDVRDFQFDMGPGYCILREGQLGLNGLVPEELRLTSMRFERFPLGSTVKEMLSGTSPGNRTEREVVEDVEGHLTVGLEVLTVPLDSFFTNDEAIPLPQIREIPSLVELVAVSSASVSINSVRLAFRALDRYYDFQDPQPVPIVLSDGTVTLARTFSLENQETFLIKQTFSGEDTKPEGLIGEEQTIVGRTTFSIDAGSSWRTDGEFDVALRIANFDVSALTDALPLSYKVNGALSGSLQLSGTSDNPKITLRRHTRDPAELYLHDVPIDLRWRIRYQNGKWEISKKRYVEVTFGQNLITFSWTMPYQFELIPFLMRLQQSPKKVWQEFQRTPMDGILDIIVKDLDMLPLVVGGLGSATGTGNVHVELTGTIETPRAIGSMSFKDVGLEFPDTGIYVKETVGEIRLSEKGANITKFDGKLNSGTFSMRGGITAPPDRRIWQTSPTLDLSASITDVTFEQLETYQASLNSAELRLHGDLLRPYLTGNLNIDSGYYQQNWESVRDWLTGVSIKEADVALDYPILRDLYLDLDINVPDSFRVLSSITGPTDIEIAFLGKLLGPINQPVFSGDVSLRSGRVGLILQPFEIIEGSTISNRDTFNFNPDLNINLRTPQRIRGVLPRDESIVDLQVHAALTGTLSNPNFTLSAPTATTAEILTHEDIIEFLIRNTSISRAFGGFTFSVQRPLEEDTRYYGEYPLSENMSIKIETNDQGEHGIDFEIKGRF